MKTQTATYTIPDFKGEPLAGRLNYRKARKLTPEIVRRRVAKCYKLKPSDVTNIVIAS